jgi:hypothetical protein
MAKTVVRISKRENPYVMLDKYFLNDTRLTWKAKGMLAYLLSKPDDWKIILDDLIKRSSDGRDSVKAGLRELEKTGYLVREQQRKADGKFGDIEYLIYERPQILVNQPLTDFPSAVYPSTGKPLTENPLLLNNDITNNDITKQQQLQSKKINSKQNKEKIKNVVVVGNKKVNHEKTVITNPKHSDTVNNIKEISELAKSLNIPLTEPLANQLYETGGRNVAVIVDALKAVDQWRRSKARKKEKVQNWAGVLVEAVNKKWQPGPEDIAAIKTDDDNKFNFLYEA